MRRGKFIYDVVIVGGGPCCTHVLRGMQANFASRGLAVPTEIAVIEPREVVGTGAPWTADDPSPMISTNMHSRSLKFFGNPYSPNPDARFATVPFDIGGRGMDYHPRHVVGYHLSDSWKQAKALARDQGFAAHHLRATVIDLEEEPGYWSVSLDTGQKVKGRVVVLALGLLATDRFPGFNGKWGYVADPWSSFAPINQMQDADAVTIMGTGPTAIDWAMRILATGYNGRLLLISRSGRLPAARPKVANIPLDSMSVREEIRRHAGEFGELGPGEVTLVINSAFKQAGVDSHEINRWLALRRKGGASLLRGTLELASEPRPFFEALKFIDGFASELWVHSSEEGKQYVLERLAGRHGDFSFAVPAHNALEMLHAIDEGQVELFKSSGKGRWVDGQFIVDVVSDEGIVPETSDWLVNATGFTGALEQATNPLVRNLAVKGILLQDRFGGASITRTRGKVCGPGTTIREGLFVAGGSLARGARYMVNSLTDTSEHGFDVGFAVATELMNTRVHKRAKTPASRR